MSGNINSQFYSDGQNTPQQQQMAIMRQQMLMQALQPQQAQPNSAPQSQAGADTQGVSNMINQYLKMQYMNQMNGTGNGLKQNVAFGLNKLGFGNASYDMLNNPKDSPGLYDGST